MALGQHLDFFLLRASGLTAQAWMVKAFIPLFIFLVILFYFVICALVYRYFVQASNYKISRVSLGNIRFEGKIPFWTSVFRLILNSVLIVCSLSFSIPWVIQDRIKFYFKHVTLLGSLDFSKAQRGEGSSTGAAVDVVGDFLGIGSEF